MKNTLIPAALLVSLALGSAYGQTNANEIKSEKREVKWSALFGLLGNSQKTDSIKVKPIVFDFDTGSSARITDAMAVRDSSEIRSLFWGAIQYSGKSPEQAAKKKSTNKQ